MREKAFIPLADARAPVVDHHHAQVPLLRQLLGSIKQKAATILVNQFNCASFIAYPGYKNIRD